MAEQFSHAPALLVHTFESWSQLESVVDGHQNKQNHGDDDLQRRQVVNIRWLGVLSMHKQHQKADVGMQYGT